MSTPEENKAIIRRYREAHNKNNLGALDAIVAKDVISHNALPGLPPGLEGGKMAHNVFLASFPDIQTKTEHLVADGARLLRRTDDSDGLGTENGFERLIHGSLFLVLRCSDGNPRAGAAICPRARGPHTP